MPQRLLILLIKLSLRMNITCARVITGMMASCAISVDKNAKGGAKTLKNRNKKEHAVIIHMKENKILSLLNALLLIPKRVSLWKIKKAHREQ